MPGAPDGKNGRALSRSALFWALLALVLAAAHFCHIGVLWAEETLPLAAATQMARGAVLYRDIWFDKPPLLAAVYLLWGAHAGWLLRLAGAANALLICALAFHFARRMWGTREARWAAVLSAFCLTFYVPSAVLPLAADLLIVAPHLAAVYLAWRGRHFASGVLAGVAFLINPKGLFVVAACALWGGLPALAAGFASITAMAAVWLWFQGGLTPYFDEVWRWGRVYAGGTFVVDPLRNALLRAADWLGFQAALVLAAAFAWTREKPRWRWTAWVLLSAAATAAGWRFFPRYFFQLMPVMVLLAARGFVLLGPRRRWAVAALLLVPLARFGPRYPELALGSRPDWADTFMDRDSRAAAALVRHLARPGDTLFVWGFRPEIYVYTGLPAASRFLDSQPLTGVPADRHLTMSTPLAPTLAQASRAELVRTRPTFILDGLGPYNPHLAPSEFPDLHPWLAGYAPVARTPGVLIYRRLP